MNRKHRRAAGSRQCGKINSGENDRKPSFNPDGLLLDAYEVLQRCPFQTAFGTGIPNEPSSLSSPTAFYVIIGGEPAAVPPDIMRNILQAVAKGETALLAADRADLRDYAKRQITAALDPPAGRA